MRLARCVAGVAVDGDQAAAHAVAGPRAGIAADADHAARHAAHLAGQRCADEIAGIAADLEPPARHARAGKPADAALDQQSRRRSCRGRRAGRDRRSRGCGRASCRRRDCRSAPSRLRKRCPSDRPASPRRCRRRQSGVRVVRISSRSIAPASAASRSGVSARQVAALRRLLLQREHQRAHPSSSPRW